MSPKPSKPESTDSVIPVPELVITTEDLARVRVPTVTDRQRQAFAELSQPDPTVRGPVLGVASLAVAMGTRLKLKQIPALVRYAMTLAKVGYVRKVMKFLNVR